MFGRWLWHAMTLFMVLDYTSAYGLPILCHFRCVLPDVHVYNRIPASERQFASSNRQFFSGLSNLFPRSCRRHCMNSKIYAGSGLRQGMPTRLCRSQHFGVAFWWKALVFRKEEKCSAPISRHFESGTDGLRLDECKMMIRYLVICRLNCQHADFAWDLSHYPESTRRESRTSAGKWMSSNPFWKMLRSSSATMLTTKRRLFAKMLTCCVFWIFLRVFEKGSRYMRLHACICAICLHGYWVESLSASPSWQLNEWSALPFSRLWSGNALPWTNWAREPGKGDPHKTNTLKVSF